MPALTAGTPLHSFVDSFRKAISDVCSTAFASAWSVAIEESDTPLAPETSWSCFEMRLTGGLQGTVAVQIRGADAPLLAQRFLAEPADPSAELKQDHTEALEKLLRQVTELVAAGLKATWGEIKFEVHNSAPPTWEGTTLTLVASEASAGSLPWKFRLSSDLSAGLSSPPVPQASTRAEGNSPTGISKEPNFDLLLGVHLDLTLRFGQRTMSLREILDLNSGSVIELDREVHEPADLLLGQRLIARGEVVIVDGNYGMRVTEMADPRQLRTD